MKVCVIKAKSIAIVQKMRVVGHEGYFGRNHKAATGKKLV